MTMLPVQQNDRPPFVFLKSPVDPSCFHLDFRFEIVISLKMTAARGSNLHKCELPLIARIFFKKSFHCKEPLQNSFGVVESVYTHSQKQPLNVQALEESRAPLVGCVVGIIGG